MKPSDLYQTNVALPPPFDGGLALRLTSYEEVRVCGTRTVQLQNAAPSTISKVVSETTSAESIAREELRQGTIPLLIRRPRAVGGDGRLLRIGADLHLRPKAKRSSPE